ncbi:MAG: hypothetical protein WBE65_03210 [Steroidobacteraceae bacterium]
MYVFLVILEPVVRFILGALALLGVLTALFFKIYGVPHFPFARGGLTFSDTGISGFLSGHDRRGVHEKTEA